MVDLVLWSFVIALTPAGLGLARKLIAGAGHFIGAGLRGAPPQGGCDWD
jgi:hypothetical protein